MSKIRKILYLSTLCSPELLHYIFISAKYKPELQVQKFHRLIVEGFFNQNNKVTVDVLSTIPVIPESHKKLVWNYPTEVVKNIKYSYIPMFNIRFLKSLSVFFVSFLKIFFWSITNKKKNNVIYCDALNLALSLSAQIACRITGLKAIGIVTDIPGMIVSARHHKNSPEYKIHNYLRLKILSKFDGYVFLTEHMNSLVNRNNRPFIVIEGVVDINSGTLENVLTLKEDKKIILYAGGLFEEYGVKNLIEAFGQIVRDDIRLHIYGGGKMENEMDYFMDKDNRIKYFGIVANDLIVQELTKATLLINPRPSKNEFTKYSFPSKNMEYMASGTPLVTTPLPGIPDEYNQFVYFINDESIEGIRTTLETLLLKPATELHNFGLRAKDFVLGKKNNHIQAQRLISLTEEILYS